MKIVVSCSRGQKASDFESLKSLLEKMIAARVEIITPFDEISKGLSIGDRRIRYITEIQDCDLLIVVVKNETSLGIFENYSTIDYGESVSWEIALAKRWDKPILYYTNKCTRGLMPLKKGENENGSCDSM